MRFFSSGFRARCTRALIRRGVSAGLLGGLAVQAQVGAQAQGRFCLGGDLDHLSAAQRTACSAKLASVRDAARRFGAPEGWHFVMVCGEEGWKAYAAFSARSTADLEAASADTDTLARSTYFREEKLGGAGPSGPSRLLDRVVAHEIAAVVLQTADEMAIEARVNLWMRPEGSEPARPAVVLTASR